jgi:hypothetical protein
VNVSAGKVIFFDSLVMGMLNLNPGEVPNKIALSFRKGGSPFKSKDVVSLAESISRLQTNNDLSPQHRTLNEICEGSCKAGLVIDCLGSDIATASAIISKHEVSTAVLFGYSTCTPELTEWVFDQKLDQNLFEPALRELFDAVGRDYDILSLIRFKSGGFKPIEDDFDLFDKSSVPNWEDLEVIERFCHNVSITWNYRDQPVDGADVFHWVMQFEEAGFIKEACQLLSYLKQWGFKSTATVTNALHQLYSELNEPDIFPLEIQPSGKSESLLSYYLNPYIKLLKPDELYKSIIPIESPTVVVFDDVIISGGSQIKFFSENVKLMELIKTDRISVLILTAFADSEGLSALKAYFKDFGNVEIRSSYVLDSSYQVFGETSRILRNMESKKRFESFCKSIGEIIYPKAPLGWNGVQWCMVLGYSVPNGCLPILWSDGKKWTHLFKRERTTSEVEETSG